MKCPGDVLPIVMRIYMALMACCLRHLAGKAADKGTLSRTCNRQRLIDIYCTWSGAPVCVSVVPGNTAKTMVLDVVQGKLRAASSIPLAWLPELGQTQCHYSYLASGCSCVYDCFTHLLHPCVIGCDGSEHCWYRAKKRRRSRSQCGCKRMGRRQSLLRQTMPPSCIWRAPPQPSPWTPRGPQTSLALTMTIPQVSLTLQCCLFVHSIECYSD